MAQRSHVPKFGNWDNDNVPYTAYFDNARKEKTGPTGLRINPNDPEENPEAFMFGRSEATPPHHLNPQKPPQKKTTRSINSESGSEKSNLDYSHLRKKSQLSDGGSSSLSPSVPGPSHTRLKSIGTPPPDDHAHRVASVPKFGAWDETDPTSGEGFTVIFNKVKQERQVAATMLPRVPHHKVLIQTARKSIKILPLDQRYVAAFRRGGTDAHGFSFSSPFI
ncbi:RPM1-interacting protein 4 [Vitis vinifera]|uniref:RPM1-interacting protein 4 n=1 Tax=Vitis vinifera TaxID=29760 RepID=A0A438EDG0_VITVI|nr:RPM1-interacting protein 4 [Vitis vinifera]